MATTHTEIEQLRQQLEAERREKAELLIENRRLCGEVAAYMEQQASTGEVLAALVAEPFDLKRVLNTIAEHAMQLAEGPEATVWLLEGEDMIPVARWRRGEGPFRGDEQRVLDLHRGKRAPDHPVRRAMFTNSSVSVPDTLALAPEAWNPNYRGFLQRLQIRSTLAVPIRHGDRVVGGLEMNALQPHVFGERHIRQVEAFAAQAAAALLQARLFTELQDTNRELQEGLEQQTVMAEVQRVIASSPADLWAVLDTITQRALQLSDATQCRLFVIEGDRIVGMARAGYEDRFAPGQQSYPMSFVYAHAESWATAKALVDRQPYQIEDIASPEAAAVWGREPGPTGAAWLERLQRHGVRTFLAVPLPTETGPVGVFEVRRTEPRRFTGEAIRLLQTFADQAVIAIENSRLLRRLQDENERKRQELERASTIQRRLLPTSIPAWPGQLEVAYRFRAAVETSGDFYDVITAAATTPDDPAPLQIAVADVAGKGMGGALVMSLARAGLRYAAIQPHALSPASTARMVSDRLHRDVGSSSFVACALATVEPSPSHRRPMLRLVNAGQVPVLLCRAGAIQELEPPGARLPLGAMAGTHYQELLEELHRADMVLFCSDGLPEAPAVAGVQVRDGLAPPTTIGELFGFDRLHQSAAYWSQQAESAEDVAQGIWSDLTAWAGEEPHHDDMTILVVRVPGT